MIARDKENLDSLIKRFKKKYSKSGIIKELRERSSYEKPSDRKRRKRRENQKARNRELNLKKETISNDKCN